LIDKTVIKLGLILLAIQLVGVFKQNITRFIIREWFTKGELRFIEWFKISFLLNITPKQILGLVIIASFTLLTFPLGIWMGSFSVGKTYPITNMIGAGLNLLTFPVNLYLMVKVLDEMELNQKTVLGIGLIVLSNIIIMMGCWLMYKGGLE